MVRVIANVRRLGVHRATFMRLVQVATSWPFLLSLLALLTNDLYLKADYSGPVTGKLSDFAGILLLSLVLFSVWPNYKPRIAATVCALFVWWKSSASESVIHLVQGLGIAAFGRTVDYTDLVALAMVPVAAKLLSASAAYRISPCLLRQVWAVPIIGFTAFGVLGTSFITLVDTYQIREATGGPSSNIQLDSAAEAIRVVAEKNGLKCKECTRPTERGRYEGRGLTMSYEIRNPQSIAFSISGTPTGLFFGGDVQEKMNTLQNDLKAQFGSRFTNLEFVEPIPQRRWR